MLGLQTHHTSQERTRDETLGRLFGDDYELGRALDERFFHRCPRTGRDALLHILGGEVVSNTLVGGFHHEPSAPAIWGDTEHDAPPTHVMLTDAGEHPATDLSQPYAAQVVIAGIRKTSLRRNGRGKTTLVPAANTMFPLDHTPIDVVRSVLTAYKNRDTSGEQLHLHPRAGARVETYGTAPLHDGTFMGVKMILDFETDKIITAVPQLPPATLADHRLQIPGMLL